MASPGLSGIRNGGVHHTHYSYRERGRKNKICLDSVLLVCDYSDLSRLQRIVVWPVAYQLLDQLLEREDQWLDFACRPRCGNSRKEKIF